MKAVILAGGKGMRLAPLTEKIPKPMIMVNNKPLIQYNVDLLKKHGITKIIFTLSYLPRFIKNYFGTGEKFGIECSYVVEKHTKPLGTAGALALLKKELTEPFIACAGDTIHFCDISKIIRFHKRKKGIATICVYKNSKSDPKSLVEFDEDNRIKKFVERPETLPNTMIWSNASLYIFQPEILSFIPKNIPSDFGKNIFPKLIKNGKKVYAYKDTRYFLDVGTKEKIEIAKKDMKIKKN